jgi:glycosyltransferase involved in cell wall biosynthesis
MSSGIILHDYFQNVDGGGRFAIDIAKNLNIDLGYGFRTANHPYFSNFPSEIKQLTLNAYCSIYGLKQLWLAHAFQKKTAFLNNYNYVIYSGFYCPLAATHVHQAKNIHYCHTPPRFIYDKYDFYLNRIPVWQRPFFHMAVNYLKPLFEEAMKHMDVILTNSHNVKNRIAHYLKKQAVVVYPPCNVEKYRWIEQGDYYLSAARLDPLKRVDKIIQAFIKMPDKKLIVMSGGKELTKLQQLASKTSNIIFTGWVSEEQLYELIGNAIATIYIPMDEDFGMSPVESMAAGKPVIGVQEGGIPETVINGETGFLIPASPTTEDIINAVTALTPQLALTMRHTCEARATQFNEKMFFDSLEKIIANF